MLCQPGSVLAGAAAAAGLTVVGVRPTHRRRGILRGMMRAQLDDVHQRGEPVACLWASEDTIYGRFGYGLASLSGDLDIAKKIIGSEQQLPGDLAPADKMKELLVFSVSEEYARLRQALGITIGV